MIPLEIKYTIQITLSHTYVGFSGGSVGKEFTYNAGDISLFPVLRRSPGGGHGNPLQYSCLENSTDREAWRDIVYRIKKKLDTTEATEHASMHTDVYTKTYNSYPTIR